MKTIETPAASADIKNEADKIIEEPSYSIDENLAGKLASASGPELLDLLAGADRIRRHFRGSDIFTCTIINAKSGKCSQDCAFCAQSAHHETGAETYPLMAENEMVDRALESEDAGATNYSIVTSGFRLTEPEIDTICRAALQISSRTGLTVCCSVGVLDFRQADKLKQSGVTNYHHNLETSRSHFSRICTTHDYETDIESIKTSADAGLSICSGGIMGLGESAAQRMELAFTLRELNVTKIPINFLNPIAGTKMQNMPIIQAAEALQAIALFRYINPDRDITICGGRQAALGDFQSWIFAAGANGLMTGNYLTTTGRDIAADMDMIARWKQGFA